MWFVSYVRRYRRDDSFVFDNRIIDEHPLLWEKNENGYDEPSEVTVLSWHELTPVELKLLKSRIAI
jgi:hypothetical protein